MTAMFAIAAWLIICPWLLTTAPRNTDDGSEG